MSQGTKTPWEDITDGVEDLAVRSDTNLRSDIEVRKRTLDQSDIENTLQSINPLGINGRLGRPISS